MPPRLNKRQQRELEELEALRTTPSNKNDDDEHKGEEEDDDSDDPEINIPPRARANATGFSAATDDLESEDDVAPAAAKSAKKNKNKKKKKVGKAVTDAASTSTPAAAPATPTSQSQSKSEKKAEKKARTKEKKADRDELDQALADLSLKYPELKKLAETPTSRGGSESTGISDRSLASLLAVSTSHLDAEGEMRKFFGAKVVQASKTSSSSGSGPRRTATGAVTRSVLTRPQSTWWSAKLREGLSIRALTDEEWAARVERHQWEDSSQERWWKVEYSKKYKSVTLAFMQTVMSGDPEGFWNLLRHLPWHADTLLQLAEVYRHREEYAQAVDFVDRALFTYERSFVGAFSFTNGMNRLDFDYVENRPFFLAVHRQVIDLQRRGCVRTAFEFARLLLSLDPWEDPHGALFHLDFLALKAGMGGWLLEMYDLHASNSSPNSSKDGIQKQQRRDTRLNPTALPGWLYARALALRYDEDSRKDKAHEGSTAALRLAVTSFPSIVPLLADKIDASIPNSVRGHVDFRIQTEGSSLTPEDAVLHLLSHAYVLRSGPLWKADASLARWFADTATSSFTSLTSSPLPKQPAHAHFQAMYSSRSLRYSVYRHTMVLEATHRRLFAFIPRDVLSAKALACDPLPPPTAVTEYTQEEFFRGSEDVLRARRGSRQQRAADERRLERMIPDGAFRQQLQAFFEANPNLAEQFPGGILQFAQNAARLPPDVLEGMMIAELNAQDIQGGLGGGMPGGMPGMDMAEMMDGGEAWRGEDGGGGHVGGFDDGDGDGDGEEEGEEDSEEEDLPPMAVRVLRNIVGRFWGGAARQEPEDSDSDDSDGDNPARLPDLVDRDGVD